MMKPIKLLLTYGASIEKVKAALKRARTIEREKVGLSGDNPYKPVSKREERHKEAMRKAVALTLERSLKSDLYLQAAQRGREDFFALLDSNVGPMAESILGLYQRILHEVGDVDTGLR